MGRLPSTTLTRQVNSGTGAKFHHGPLPAGEGGWSSLALLLVAIGGGTVRGAAGVKLSRLLSIAAAILTVRMKIDDDEAHPIGLLGGAVTYWPWLAWEIVKSGWGVTKIILSPRLAISPTLTKVRASQTSSPGIATYGNSITLTPGTITTDVRGHTLTVHALTTAGAIDLEEGSMDRRVKKFEGSFK